jgi:N-terminal domain of ribose phosphate pyrophosphokinase
MPHYAYARSDKKDAPRISIGVRLVADLLVTAGADRILTMTLHSPQVHGFFSVPVEHLHARGEDKANARQQLNASKENWRRSRISSSQRLLCSLRVRLTVLGTSPPSARRHRRHG